VLLPLVPTAEVDQAVRRDTTRPERHADQIRFRFAAQVLVADQLGPGGLGVLALSAGSCATAGCCCVKAGLKVDHLRRLKSGPPSVV
jgi:hypothetical protein